MSNRSGSQYSTPRDANRVPFLVAASTADGITPVVLEADPTTHALVTSSSGGGGGGTQYTDGSSTITHPIGTIPVYDKAGTITAVSVANPLPVSASVAPPSDTTQTGSITGSGQSVTFAVNAQSTVGIQASGTFSGTILIKGSVDGSTYTPTTATSLTSGALVTTITTAFTGQVNVAGFVSFQLTSVSWTSGTANISLRASTGISNVMLDNSLPAGTNTIGSVTQATASNFNTTAQITDGTNVANTLKSDGTAAGQNSQLVAGTGINLTGLSAGSLNADLIPSTDVTNYKGGNVTITGTFTGTISFQGSNDNSIFFNIAIIGSDLSATNAGTFAAAGTVQTTKTFPIYFKYLRVRMTAYTSGTANGTAELTTQPFNIPLPTMQQAGTWTVGSNSATGAAVPANAFYMAGISGGNLTGLPMTAAADGLGMPTMLETLSWLTAFNGTTNDRVRTANAASNTTGTGLLGVGNMIFDGTNWQKQSSTTAIGTVGTTSAVVNVGQQTSNTSAVQLSASSTIPTNGIVIEALIANAAVVYIGGSGVTTSTGFQLSPGQSLTLTCNLNTIYVIGSNATDKVCWSVA